MTNPIFNVIICSRCRKRKPVRSVRTEYAEEPLRRSDGSVILLPTLECYEALCDDCDK